MRHNSQGMVVKQGSNPRQVWDGSTMYTPMDIVMNEMTPTENEAEITLGMAKILFYQYLYYLRKAYPKIEQKLIEKYFCHTKWDFYFIFCWGHLVHYNIHGRVHD